MTAAAADVDPDLLSLSHSAVAMETSEELEEEDGLSEDSSHWETDSVTRSVSALVRTQ